MSSLIFGVLVFGVFSDIWCFCSFGPVSGCDFTSTGFSTFSLAQYIFREFFPQMVSRLLGGGGRRVLEAISFKLMKCKLNVYHCNKNSSKSDKVKDIAIAIVAL